MLYRKPYEEEAAREWQARVRKGEVQTTPAWAAALQHSYVAHTQVRLPPKELDKVEQQRPKFQMWIVCAMIVFFLLVVAWLAL